MSLQSEPIPPKIAAPPTDRSCDASAATLKLADEYRKAAERLYADTNKKDLLALAPWRLLAIHAIELYLNSFLIRKGSSDKALRCMQHSFSERAKLALNANLALKKKTAEHLISITEKREYVVSRYDTGSAAELSKLNRLTATLHEISTKVAAAVA